MVDDLSAAVEFYGHTTNPWHAERPTSKPGVFESILLYIIIVCSLFKSNHICVYNLQNKSAHICTMFVAERFFPIQTDFRLYITLPWSHPVAICILIYPPRNYISAGYDRTSNSSIRTARRLTYYMTTYILLSSSKSTYKWENSL